MIAPPNTRYSKYRWTEISRVNPSKRLGSERVRNFAEIVEPFDEWTVRDQASRCVQCALPQCMEGCPLQNRIPEWLALAAEGSFIEAAAVSNQTSNMPEICSRVCPQERLCEGACVLNKRSHPVTIGAVEKFINEYAFQHQPPRIVKAAPNGLTVAIVGSGPAGMACADELAKLGYAVTVFEAQKTLGGLLMNGIPGFKLDKNVINRRLDLLYRRGVTFKPGIKIGTDLPFEELQRSFNAVFLGIGAQKAKSADIPGEELDGVHPALPFLIQYNAPGPFHGKPVDVRGKNVVVLGGGDTAMDCLRTALRAGSARSVCLYRRDLANMPGSRKEYYNAVEEGAEFEFLTSPVSFVGNPSGAVSGVQVVRMKLGEPDLQGRRKPVTIPGSEYLVPADLVLVAYGFDPEPAPKFENADLAVDRWGALQVDRHQMTSLPGVFAGGDSSRGASLVVHAVRDGRTAARGIHLYLEG